MTDLGFQMAEANLILKVNTGAKLYGTSTPDSDDDYMGIFIPNREYVYGLKNIEQVQIQDGKVDYTSYSILKYIKLAINNNPNILSILFTPKEHILYSNFFSDLLLNHKKLFISKRCLDTYRGYAAAQRHKVLLKDKVNGKRMNLIEKYGFDTKFAMHLIRLLFELRELLIDGKITYPSKSVQVLKDIRVGYYSQDEVLAMSHILELECNVLAEKTDLPNTPNELEIEKLQIDIIESFYNRQRMDNYEISMARKRTSSSGWAPFY